MNHDNTSHESAICSAVSITKLIRTQIKSRASKTHSRLGLARRAGVMELLPAKMLTQLVGSAPQIPKIAARKTTA